MLNTLKAIGHALYQQPALLLTLAAAFWAGNAVAGRVAVGQISPLMLVCLRWVLVVFVLWALYGSEVRAHWSEVRPRLPRIILMATLGFTAFNTLLYVGAHHTTAINIGILQGSMPIFVLIGAFLAHGTKVSAVQLAGVLITTLGVLVVATAGHLFDVLHLSLNKGDLAMLAACVLYAFYTVALRDRPKMSGAAFFTLLAVIAALTSLPLVALEAAVFGFTLPTMEGWLLTAYVAIFPSCLSQLFYLRGVDLVGPGVAGVYINLVPVFAAVLAVLLINEPFALYHAVALALVIAGIWLAQRPAATGARR